ncbi:extracellular solute-binding protein [Paenibacillus sp. GCM10027626]|uniref:extracellular solute-binding protein n=1 Tax=Paenibacillus sp. GCM10027626 TaxID=3273411 RepID=UPI00363936C3
MVYTRKALLLGLISAFLLLAACGNGGNGGNAGSDNQKGNQAETNTPGQEKGNSGNEAAAGPNGKYDPPIELSTIRMISPEQYFDEGEKIDNNAIYSYYENKFGIKLKNKWTVTNDYDSKLKIAIASNDLPDFYRVPASDLQQLIDNDMIMDLTELWDKQTTELTKQEFTKDGGRQLKTATFGGKLMAIPQTNSPFNRMGFVWVRQDWLKEMNLPEPKTMADLLAISEAFAKRDGGGKGKTYGLLLSQNLSLSGFFSGYHLYPGQWVKDENGQLMYGTLNPSMKEALQQLQTMFKAGQIDPEFGVKDDGKALELAVNGQIGLLYGEFWHSAALQAGAVKDGKVVQDWAAYPIPSIDSQPALNPTTASVSTFYVINKNAENPEAVFKLLNEWIESQVKPNEDNKTLVFGKDKKDKGKFFYEINPLIVFSQDNIVMSGDLIPKALKNNDPAILGEDVDRLARYEAAKQFKDGTVTEMSWLQHMIAGEGGTMSKMYEAYQQDLFHYDEFYGAPTPAMGEKWSVLKAKEDETISKIIMGSAPVEEYDRFIAEWKRLGGEQITQEVNEWWQSIE